MIKQSWLSMNFWLNVLIFSFFLVPFSYGIQNKLIKRVGNVFGPGVDVLNNKKIHVTTNKSNAINVLPFLKVALEKKYGPNSGEVACLNEFIMDLGNTSEDLETNTMPRIEIPEDSSCRYIGLKIMIEGSFLDKGSHVENIASRLLQLGINKMKRAENLFLTYSAHRFSELTTNLSPQDVPCDSDRDCERLNKMINSCDDARKICYSMYATYNQVTNVLNQVVSVLCACIFVGPVKLCALKNFPYTCVFPYQVLSTFSTGSGSVWEAIKTLSSLCRFHTDPRITPKIE